MRTEKVEARSKHEIRLIIQCHLTTIRVLSSIVFYSRVSDVEGIVQTIRATARSTGEHGFAAGADADADADAAS